MKNDNKYGLQIDKKFERLRIGTTCIEISRKDPSPDTIYHLDEAIKHCKTSDEAYQTLNGIIPDVIARIAKQVEHRILAKTVGQDQVLLLALPQVLILLRDRLQTHLVTRYMKYCHSSRSSYPITISTYSIERGMI